LPGPVSRLVVSGGQLFALMPDETDPPVVYWDPPG
jgi:hypothetical protein